MNRGLEQMENFSSENIGRTSKQENGYLIEENQEESTEATSAETKEKPENKVEQEKTLRKEKVKEWLDMTLYHIRNNDEKMRDPEVVNSVASREALAMKMIAAFEASPEVKGFIENGEPQRLHVRWKLKWQIYSGENGKAEKYLTTAGILLSEAEDISTKSLDDNADDGGAILPEHPNLLSPEDEEFLKGKRVVEEKERKDGMIYTL